MRRRSGRADVTCGAAGAAARHDRFAFPTRLEVTGLTPPVAFGLADRADVARGAAAPVAQAAQQVRVPDPVVGPREHLPEQPRERLLLHRFQGAEHVRQPGAPRGEQLPGRRGAPGRQVHRYLPSPARPPFQQVRRLQ